MMTRRNFRKILLAGCAMSLFAISCKKKEKSNATGWNYNDPQNGGYLKVDYVEQETGPGLVLIEGGTFTMGRSEQDVTYDWDNTPRRVTVKTFYIDETEVTNQYWVDYLHWTRRTYTDFPLIYKKALPDTLVWRSKLGYNEPQVEYYLRHPAYQEYPVVGVSWLQANNYCSWRSDRVNEVILIREGILLWNNDQQNEPFNTDAYLRGQFSNSDNPKGQLKDLDPSNGGGSNGKKRIKKKDLADRIVRMEDGIMLPKYRLPTEAEWEFAAYGLIGNTNEERITNRRIYPWDGHWVRNPDEKFQGQMQANFVRGRGDYMGVAGSLNDNADITAPVTAYWPNDYGLYNMAGNVSEWVMDVYRPLSSEDYDEFSPFRGNVFKTKVLNSEGGIADKLDEAMYEVNGIKEYIVDFTAERKRRRGGVITDSLDFILLAELDSLVSIANEMYNDGRRLEASRYIREIVETNLPDIGFRIQSEPGFEDFQYEIIPKIIVGISDFVINVPGNLKVRNVTKEENLDRRNYEESNYIDYLDGDLQSSIYYNNDEIKESINEFNQQNGAKRNRTGYNPDNLVYQNGKNKKGMPTSLITDQSRVYKGGSWKDRAFWMSPGNRRYYDEFRATDYIGFRCAMTRVGSPVGLNYKRGKKKKKKK
ncbi:MAG: SUMF1/EgtB/PvdO family nonheme iron enzyme [Flavobacteriales bacterium]